MYACFSNIGNWDEQCLGFLGVVKGEDCITKGYTTACGDFIRKELVNPDNASTKEWLTVGDEIAICSCEDEKGAYDDLCDENELSSYFNGTPTFFAVLPGGSFYDGVFVFIKL